MIELDCPHCGNHIRVREKYAGREGWCRSCKRLIILPDLEGNTMSIDELPTDKRHALLEKVLKCAATKAEIFRAQAHAEKTLREQLEESSKNANKSANESNEKIEEINDRINHANIELEEAKVANTRLKQALEKERVQRCEAEKAREVAESALLDIEEGYNSGRIKLDELNTLKESYAALEHEKEQAQKQLEELNTLKESCAALEHENEETQKQLDELKGEIDSLQEDKMATQRSASTHESSIEHLSRELEGTKSKLDAIQSELKDSKVRNADLAEERDRLDIELDNGRTEIAQLKEDIDSLKIQLEIVTENTSETMADSFGTKLDNYDAEETETLVVKAEIVNSDENTDNENDEMTEPESDSIFETYLRFLKNE